MIGMYVCLGKHTYPENRRYVCMSGETYIPGRYVWGNIHTWKMIGMYVCLGKHTYPENRRYVCMSGETYIPGKGEVCMYVSGNIET